jgi:hypothetical protein
VLKPSAHPRHVDTVYYCPSLDRVSNKAGVYVLARSFAAVVAPLYVGQATRLSDGIAEPQFNLGVAGIPPSVDLSET